MLYLTDDDSIDYGAEHRDEAEGSLLTEKGRLVGVDIRSKWLLVSNLELLLIFLFNIALKVLFFGM